MLPVVPLDTAEVTVNGEAVAIRSLSRDEVVKLSDLAGDTEAAEVLMLSRACDIPPDAAREWRTKVNADTVGMLLKAIAVLSGIRDPEANHPDPAADDGTGADAG